MIKSDNAPRLAPPVSTTTETTQSAHSQVSGPSLPEAARSLRSRAGLTLKELSARSGIATSTLSKIENGQLSPTYEKIVQLADGLGVDVAELFSRGDGHTMASGRRTVCRHGEGVVHATPQYVYEMLCADVTRKQFIPIYTKLRAHRVQEFPALLHHEGEEFIYVLDGVVTLQSDFYEPLVLNEGDCCYFDSRMGHALVSSGPSDASILWICSKNTPMPHDVSMPIPAASSKRSGAPQKRPDRAPTRAKHGAAPGRRTK